MVAGHLTKSHNNKEDLSYEIFVNSLGLQIVEIIRRCNHSHVEKNYMEGFMAKSNSFMQPNSR